MKRRSFQAARADVRRVNHEHQNDQAFHVASYEKGEGLPSPIGFTVNSGDYLPPMTPRAFSVQRPRMKAATIDTPTAV